MTQDAVYLIWAKGTNRFKIGRSRDSQSRLRRMQTGSPYQLEVIAETHEAAEIQFHKRFADFRVKGEWFEVPIDGWGELLAAFSVNPALVNVLVQALSESMTANRHAIHRLAELNHERSKAFIFLKTTFSSIASNAKKITDEVAAVNQSRVDALAKEFTKSINQEAQARIESLMQRPE